MGDGLVEGSVRPAGGEFDHDTAGTLGDAGGDFDDAATPGLRLGFAKFGRCFRRAAERVEQIVSRDVKQQSPEVDIVSMAAQAVHRQSILLEFAVALFTLTALDVIVVNLSSIVVR